MIGSATSTLDMEFFYISNKQNEPLQQVVDAIKAASVRGVQVRIIADARMAKTYPETLEELDLLSNIEVRKISLYNQMGGIMHAKYFIVDRKQVFVGSQNMDWRALKHIHELGVTIRNSKLAKLISKIFELDWQISGEQKENVPATLTEIPKDILINAANPLKLTDDSGNPLYLYPTFSPRKAIFPGMEWDETEIVKLIDDAKQRVEIQLLTYKPVSHGYFYDKLDNALRRAAARGVQVRMILSNWDTREPGVQFLKSLEVVPNVEVRISTIPQWSGGFVPFGRVEHCKYMVSDDHQVWIGTSNWSYSYFHTSRNLGFIIKNDSVNQTLHDIFMKSWDSPYAEVVNPAKTYQAPNVGGDEGK
ncbi:MAG: phospholipase D-like domain-containing protein [Calditrichia bacterium]